MWMASAASFKVLVACGVDETVWIRQTKLLVAEAAPTSVVTTGGGLPQSRTNKVRGHRSSTPASIRYFAPPCHPADRVPASAHSRGCQFTVQAIPFTANPVGTELVALFQVARNPTSL